MAGGQVGRWAGGRWTDRQIQMEVYRREGEKQIDRQTDGETVSAIQKNTQTNRQMQIYIGRQTDIETDRYK
jgi:hypothetical protein